MGKKSREKRERRELGKETERKPVLVGNEEKVSRVFLWLIYGATVLVLFTPLIISPKFYFPFVGPKSLYFMGLAQIAIFSWLGLQLVSKKYRPQSNPVTIALIVFFVILILASLFGVSPSNSFWSKFERMTGILMWGHLIGFFLVLVSVFKKEADWQKIFAVSLLVAVVVSLLSLTGQGGSTKEGATIGNTSFMGTYLLLNVFWAIYLFFRPPGSQGDYFNIREHKGWRGFAAVCFLIIAVALYYSTAQAALLCFWGGLYLLVLFYLAFKPSIRWLRTLGKVLLITSFLVALVAVISLASPQSPVRQKFIEQATKSRLVVWEKAWKGFKERPLLGWGPENYELVFTRHFNPCMFLPECGSEIWFDRSHNIIFDTLVTSGILGLLGYLAILVAAFYTSFKKYLKSRLGFWTFAVPSVILIAYFIQNLTVFDMISSYLMFFLILGFMASSRAERKEEGLTRVKNQWVFGLLFIIFCFTFFEFVWQPSRTDAYVINSLLARTPDERLMYYQRALAASPLGKYQIREFFAQRSQSILSGRLKEVPPTILDQELGYVADVLEKTRREYPLDFRSVLRLAQIYNIHGFVEPKKLLAAEKAARQAIRLSPTNQQGYWALAQALLYQGRFEPAYPLAEKAVLLEPRWFQSHQIALKIAKVSGNQELVEELRQRALEINPNWQEEIEQLLQENNSPTS